MAIQLQPTHQKPVLIKEALFGRKKNHRIDWSGLETKQCLYLARKMFTVETIARYTGLTVNQVRRRLKMKKISIADYRRGDTFESAQVLAHHTIYHNDQGKASLSPFKKKSRKRA
jgi:hypothetical protein